MMVFRHVAITLFVFVWIMALQLSRLSYTGLPLSTVMEVRLSHFAKASSPMEVTELGMLTVVRLQHSEKALSPIYVTELGILMEVRLRHP